MKEIFKIIISILAAFMFVGLVVGLMFLVIKVTFYVAMIVVFCVLTMFAYFLIPWEK